MSDYGDLASALAAAQAAFPPIARDKEVTVQTKTGGSYKFKYAPLDTILNDTRKALTDNGLAITQLIDSDPDGMPVLLTRLMHRSGGHVEGRTPIPHAPGESVQVFGSAVTYMRRYAIQALLGITAEEDDDGNAASGNRAEFTTRTARQTAQQPATATQRPAGVVAAPEGITGTVRRGNAPVDCERRETPDGPVCGFSLEADGKRMQVLAAGPMAESLALVVKDAIGQSVTVWGRVEMVPWEKDGKAMPPYRRLHLERIAGPGFVIPGTTAPADDLEDLKW